MDKSLKAMKFTLIELLVVIAVIALLASLLLPALSSAKARGREMACASNIRQCAFAMHMYAGDFNDNIIIYLYRPGNVYAPGYSARWSEVLNGSWGVEYLKSTKAVLCPSMAPDKYISTSYTYGAVLSGEPGVFTPGEYNSGGCSGTMINVSKVVSPSNLTLLGDSVSASSGPYMQIYIISKKAPTTNYGGIHLRHSNGANMAFLDGHAKNLKRDEARFLSFTRGYLSSCDLVDL